MACTVGELRKRLKEFDQDLPVVFVSHNDWGGYIAVEKNEVVGEMLIVIDTWHWDKKDYCPGLPDAKEYPVVVIGQ